MCQGLCYLFKEHVRNILGFCYSCDSKFYCLLLGFIILETTEIPFYTGRTSKAGSLLCSALLWGSLSARGVFFSNAACTRSLAETAASAFGPGARPHARPPAPTHTQGMSHGSLPRPLRLSSAKGRGEDGRTPLPSTRCVGSQPLPRTGVLILHLAFVIYLFFSPVPASLPGDRSHPTPEAVSFPEFVRRGPPGMLQGSPAPLVGSAGNSAPHLLAALPSLRSPERPGCRKSSEKYPFPRNSLFSFLSHGSRFACGQAVRRLFQME